MAKTQEGYAVIGTEGEVPRAKFSPTGANTNGNNGPERNVGPGQERHLASQKTAKPLETGEDSEVVPVQELEQIGHPTGYWSQSGPDPTRFWKMGRKFALKIIPATAIQPHT